MVSLIDVLLISNENSIPALKSYHVKQFGVIRNEVSTETHINMAQNRYATMLYTAISNQLE